MQPTPQAANRMPPALKLGVLLATMFVLLCYAVDHIWASSSDFAHHYALVARLAQQWTLPPGVDPSLGEMNIYPRSSHILAALVGTLFHSSFLGMHLVTLLSMMAVWAALGALLLTLPRRAGLPALLILLLLVSLNFGRHRIDLFGIEDIVNFFFAQLVAQAFMAGALLLALRLERAGQPPALRYAVLLASIYLIAGMHLLPAAQLVCITLGSVALDILRQPPASPRQRLRQALPGLATMLGAVAMLALHPAFAAMREISKNDGDLFPVLFSTPGRIAVLCVVILALSGWLVLRWSLLERRQANAHYLVMKYVGLFGLAASGLCLLQIVLLHLGQGSEYAVKKYIFSLDSVLVLELALLPLLLNARLRAAVVPAGDGGLFYGTLALPLLTAVAFRALTSGAPYLDASDVTALEHQLELRRDISVPPHPGKFVYVLDVPGMPGGVSYMMTIGVFGTPRTANSLDVLGNRTLSEPGLVGTIITGTKSTYGQMESCLLPGSNSQLAMVEGACAYRSLNAGRQRVGFTAFDGQPACMLSGFSGAEEGGRWSAATEATIQCQIPKLKDGAAHSITLAGAPFLHGAMQQRLSVRANDGPAHDFLFKPGQVDPTVLVPLPQGSEGKLTLRLTLPDAASPKQLGLSPDERQLGWMLKSLEFN